MRFSKTPFRRACLAAAGCLAPLGGLLCQNPPSQGAPASAPAATYLERYREVTQLGPLPAQVADVEHLVLTHDAGRLTLERGKLYLLSPVGGRTVGAGVSGDGGFSVQPAPPLWPGALQPV